MKKHRLTISASTLFGAPLQTVALDMFGEKEDAERTAKEYRIAMRRTYGLLTIATSRIDSMDWSVENAEA